MSADYWLEYDGREAGDDCSECEHRAPAVSVPIRSDHETGAHSWNVTYNLGEMLRAAGLPPFRALVGAPTTEVAGMLDGVVRCLRAEPERFKAFNPENGWGTYEGAVEFVESFRDGCATHPHATIGAWL